MKGRPGRLSEATSSVMMRSIPQHITEADIRECLAQYQIAYKFVKIVKDPKTQTPKGFGFVDFDSVAQAEQFVYDSPFGHALFVVKGERIDLDFSKAAGGGSAASSAPSNQSNNSRSDGDWMCGYCNSHNFSKRSSCYVCKVVKDDKAIPVTKSRSFNGHHGGGALNPVTLVSGAGVSQPAAILQVSGLDPFTDQDTVRYSFAPFGVVKDVRLVYDHESGRSTGVAFVELSTVGEASAAMSSYKRAVSSNSPFLIDRAPVLLEYYNPVSNVAAMAANSMANWQYQAQIHQQQNPVQQIPGVPDGFVYNPAYGCYYNAATQYFYDVNTKLFYNSLTGAYYQFDVGSQQYVQVNVSEQGASSSAEQTPRTTQTASSVSPEPETIASTEEHLPSSAQPEVPHPVVEDVPAQEQVKPQLEKSKNVDKGSSVKFTIKGKKLGKDMARWSQQKQILDEELEIEKQHQLEVALKKNETRKNALVVVDWIHFACLLCQRKFRNENHLKRHAEESNLHKSNLSLSYENQVDRIRESCARASLPLPEALLEAQSARQSTGKRKRFEFMVCCKIF
eukprot:TRINITY_DN4093_c0_g1_i9.p1 TRINITY_DN4093_c0_g1~~TRINITY_DN4093_c0_g1_i9.p1  ORF type:complete len:564 (-),score=134.00 TRINITY_DN4093_c0_g1_i9:1279-2970(-)